MSDFLYIIIDLEPFSINLFFMNIFERSVLANSL